MDTRRWIQTRQLFSQWLDLEPTNRAALLNDPASADPAVREDVRSLIHALDSSEGFLEQPPHISLTDESEVEPPAAAAEGQRIGRYVIHRLIATGGMGAVYEAEQESPRRRVALKVLRSTVATPSALRRFRRESEILGALQHPGIAQVLEAGLFDPDAGQPGAEARPYFAMELVDGVPVSEYVKSRALTRPEKLDLLLQACNAVQHAHERLVVHLDLKPSNILVDRAGRVRVLDFGVARFMGTRLPNASMATTHAELVGTVPYMSPEQLGGHEDAIDQRCDVYALGVILYELLAGRAPLDVRDKPLFEACRLIREEEPTLLGRIDRALRGDLETIVATAMSKDRALRYTSAAELATDLRRHLEGRPIAARSPGTWYRARKFASRNRILVAGIAGIFLALVAGLVATTWQAARATRAESQARQEFEDFRALTREAVVGFQDAIGTIPGGMESTRVLVLRSMANLDKLASLAPDDPLAAHDLAKAYISLASLQGAPTAQNLMGDVEAAIASFAKAEDIAARQLARDPADVTARELFTKALMSRAVCLQSDGRAAEGLDDLARAYELACGWVAVSPNRQEELHRLANLCWRLVALEVACGQADAARSRLSQTCERVNAARPPSGDDFTETRHAGSLRLVLGASLIMVGDPAAALTMLETAEQYFWRALATTPTPDDPDHFLDLGDVCRYSGVALAMLGAQRHAIGAFESAIDEYLLASHKQAFHLSIVDVLGSTRLQLAHALADLGDASQATALAEEAMQGFESLMHSDSASAKARTRYAASCWEAGRIQETLAHDPESSQEWRREARDRAGRLYAQGLEALQNGPHQPFDAMDGGVTLDELCSAFDRCRPFEAAQ